MIESYLPIFLRKTLFSLLLLLMSVSIFMIATGYVYIMRTVEETTDKKFYNFVELSLFDTSGGQELKGEEALHKVDLYFKDYQNRYPDLEFYTLLLGGQVFLKGGQSHIDVETLDFEALQHSTYDDAGRYILKYPLKGTDLNGEAVLFVSNHFTIGHFLQSFQEWTFFVVVLALIGYEIFKYVYNYSIFFPSGRIKEFLTYVVEHRDYRYFIRPQETLANGHLTFLANSRIRKCQAKFFELHQWFSELKEVTGDQKLQEELEAAQEEMAKTYLYSAEMKSSLFMKHKYLDVSFFLFLLVFVESFLFPNLDLFKQHLIEFSFAGLIFGAILVFIFMLSVFYNFKSLNFYYKASMILLFLSLATKSLLAFDFSEEHITILYFISLAESVVLFFLWFLKSMTVRSILSIIRGGGAGLIFGLMIGGYFPPMIIVSLSMFCLTVCYLLLLRDVSKITYFEETQS